MKRILAVDDDQDILNLLRRYLRDTYDLTTASNGEEALKLLESQSIQPELILLDMEMPGMNGKVFAKRVKADPRFKKIPIVYFTSSDRYKDEVELDNEFSFLNKPIEKEDLLSVLEVCFRTKAS